MNHRMRLVIFTLLALLFGSAVASTAAVVEFRDDGVMLLDGEPTTVYGTFRDPSDERMEFDGIKEAGFNLTHDYGFEQFKVGSPEDEARWIADAREYLRAAEGHGLGVFMGLPRNLVYAGDTGALGRLVEAVRDEPALWFWYTLDEPLLQKASFARASPGRQWHEVLTDVYNTIKRLDGDHPVVVVDSGPRILEKSTPEELEAHRTLCDAIWVDTYAVPYSVLAVGRDVAELRERLPGVTVWAVPEGGAQFPITQWHFNARRKPGDKGYDEQWQFPRPEFNDRLAEMEFTPKAVAAQYFGAWAMGCRGVVFYWPPKWTLDIKGQTPAIWRAYVELGATLEELGPMLHEAQPTDAVRVEHDRWGQLDRQRYLLPEGVDISGEDLRKSPTAATWAGEWDGSYWVVIAVDYAPVQSFEVTLPGPIRKITQYPGAKVVAEAGEGEEVLDFEWDAIAGYVRKVRRDGTALQLIVGELDVVVWRIDTAGGGSAGDGAASAAPAPGAAGGAANRPPAVGDNDDANER